MRKLYLLVMLSVLSCALFVQTAHAGIALEDKPAPINPEFLKWRSLPESVNALPGEKTYATGSIPDPIDRSHLKDNPPILQNPRAKYPQSVKEITIPAKYDMREDNRLPAVREQNPWGTCWAFAAIGSLESSYITLQNSWPYNYRYDHTVPNLSELHTAYFVYGDTRPGKSFSQPEPRKDILDQGGNVRVATALIARCGTVKESSLPYPNSESYSAPDGYPEDYMLSDIRVKEAYILANLDTEAAINTVKRIILEQAGVVISYYAGRGATSPTGSPAYFDNTHGTETNHAVLLVGWDDNFSRENFSASMRPSRNGAWLVRNSWGKYNGSDSGYFWMSYEQYTASPAALIADKANSLTEHYGYDDLYIGAWITSNEWNANIFKAAGKYGSEYLKYVGLHTIDNNTQYEIYVYDLGVNVPSSPVAGKLIANVTDGYAPYQGYSTVELKEYPKIEKGHYFSIVVHSDTGLGLEGSTSWSNGRPQAEPVCNSGESYGSSDGRSWSERDKNACIKAFTVPYIYDSTPPGDDAIQINARNFPDDVFRRYVSSMFDDDDNGWLTESEIKNVKEIYISKQGVTSLKGIEHFTKLEELDCHSNKIVSLDLGFNPALEKLYCYDNQLSELFLLLCTSLYDIDCHNNRLTELFIIGNNNLEYLDCRNNRLEELHVIDCPGLVELLCTSNNLGEIDLSGCSYVSVKADENASVKGWLRVNSANFPDENFRRYVISEFGNGDDFLSPEEIADITELNISGQGITSLKGIEHFNELTWLFCENNNLTQLDVSKNTELTELSCENNKLTKLDLSKNTRLKYLECGNNQLSSINLSGCKNLTWLVCCNNKLTTLDISSCPDIDPYCDENVIIIRTASKTITISGTLPNTTRRATYSATLTASGGAGSYTWTNSKGKLPDGFTLNASTGKITGSATKAGTFSFTAQAKDKNGATGTKDYTVKVTQTAVTGSIPTTITRRATYKGTPTATGGASPYVWSISAGKLPDGLKINASTGKITGNPTKAGTFTFTVKAKDKNGAAGKKEYTVKVTQTAVTGSIPTTTTRRATYKGTPTATGGASPYVWSISAGKLPDGLKINASTGKITGNPTKAGTFTFTVKAKDKNGAAGKKEYTVKVTQAAVTGSIPTTITRRATYKGTPTATGGASPYVWSISAGKLPDGLKINSSTGAITGTATKAGTFTFTVKAKDKNGAAGKKEYTVKVTQTAVTGSIPTTTTRRATYKGTPTATGGASPYQWSISAGKLPDGLKINASTGKITGTATKAGTFTFTIKAKDKNGAAGKKEYTVKVTQTKVTGNLTMATKGASYSAKPKATGGAAPYVWSISSGKLPSGLTINSSTGKISGTPTQTGSFKFTVKAKDKNGAAGKKEYTLKVVASAVVSALPAIIPQSVGNTVFTFGPSLRVISEDAIEVGEGRDNDIFTVKAGHPLTFILGAFDVDASELAVYVDDERIEGVIIFDEGIFTLPSEYVHGDFKVQVKSSNNGIESEEAFIISE